MNTDLLVKKVIAHDEQLATMVTQATFDTFRRETTSTLDHILTVVTRIDEERYATVARFDRLEERLGTLEVQSSALQEQVADLQEKVDIIDTRLCKVEAKVDIIDTRLLKVEKNVEQLLTKK